LVSSWPAWFFLVSGGIPMIGGRRRRKKAVDGKAGRSGSGESPASLPAARDQAGAATGDDDLAGVRDILKRHGIS
jgi:hypothetical protein